MSAVFLWYLVSVSAQNAVHYSPPMVDQATCEFVKKSVDEISHGIRTRCIQIKQRS